MDPLTGWKAKYSLLFFENLAVNYYTLIALHFADKFLNGQQIFWLKLDGLYINTFIRLFLRLVSEKKLIGFVRRMM